MEIKVRYSDKDLQEFKGIIEEKLHQAQADLEFLRNAYLNGADNSVDDTSPTFKAFEEGSEMMSWRNSFVILRTHLSVLRIKPMEYAV